MHRPFFSIIIPTYNSEKTLKYTLESIAKQNIAQNELEILIIDGGSTDKTRSIAQEHNVIILDNPKRLPEYAKAIGIRHASGHYVVRMDSDEEFTYPTQLKDKMEYFQNHQNVKMLLSNCYVSGRRELCGISCDYMNILGDPFSYFVYKTKADKYQTYRKNIIQENGRFVTLCFNFGDIYPLGDSATCTLSLDYMKEKFPEEYASICFVCQSYDRVLADTKLCGLIRGDNIKHNCSSSFKIYLSKLKFRVINNLFHKEEGGFSAKEHLSAELSRRKWLFCLYALLVPIPLLDSIRLAIVHRNATFLLHFIYLYYVCFQIVWLSIIKLFGGNRENLNYGK